MKCKFVRAKMEYLGHIISNDGIQTDLKKIKSTSDNQNWHVMAYRSKALNTTECKGYMIMFFLNKWRHLLLGVEVEVLLDRHALQWLFNQ
ncbi:uncharacterized protein ACA1_231130 [Acanthamoeba castellanii str. Neff]|uniref:Reverse transcriptase RNase H-like domain-containing protein n=1 Tax=Acanthamoeba castellanii (strain ATCC 30010 / Neff) TaxID=1257118 RepID=L8HBB8_ACACF|nr:uncharacterized protein ACA1_231130 [Acanthamoeba castellanii str. Neff]ELR21676.1 hypothetical protein ACA1_231130 [Acanthamoeba castellanii str. Neff]